MKKPFLLISALFLLSGSAIAQSNPLDKKLEKAKELVSKQKTDEAEKYLRKLLAENPGYGEGWDYLAQLNYNQYEQVKATDNLFNNITVTTTTADGKPVSDSMANGLKDLLTSIKPSKKAYSKFLYTAREGIAHSRDALYCSVYIRMFNVDVEVDSNITKKALKYYKEAEEEFASGNYNKAAQFYQRALDEQPAFYKASLYLGDCYYMTQNYPLAVQTFKDACKKFPALLEPRKYLADAYAKSRLYDKSLEECVNTFLVYPDCSMMQKLDDAAFMNNKQLRFSWTARAVLPNSISDTNAKNTLNDYTEDEEIAAGSPWKAYREAQAKIAQYCNKKGIITVPNSVTNAKYLELYSWEEMLRNSKDPLLDEARKMQEAGYLDCYVMVTCFHYDFYDQYRDFVANNSSKIQKYFNIYLQPR